MAESLRSQAVGLVVTVETRGYCGKLACSFRNPPLRAYRVRHKSGYTLKNGHNSLIRSRIEGSSSAHMNPKAMIHIKGHLKCVSEH
jgi:hypothetical protein